MVGIKLVDLYRMLAYNNSYDTGHALGMFVKYNIKPVSVKPQNETKNEIGNCVN